MHSSADTHGQTRTAKPLRTLSHQFRTQMCSGQSQSQSRSVCRRSVCQLSVCFCAKKIKQGPSKKTQAQKGTAKRRSRRRLYPGVAEQSPRRAKHVRHSSKSTVVLLSLKRKKIVSRQCVDFDPCDPTNCCESSTVLRMSSCLNVDYNVSNLTVQMVARCQTKKINALRLPVKPPNR
eukprot:Selendium_serpulae@DN10412_c0_g1_i1.p1